MSPELLKVADVSAMLKVSTRQVWKLVASGRLPPPVPLGRSLRWRAGDIADFIRLGCPGLERFEAARDESRWRKAMRLVWDRVVSAAVEVTVQALVAIANRHLGV